MRKASLITFLLPVFCIAVVMGTFGCSSSEEEEGTSTVRGPAGGPGGGPGAAGRPGGGGPGRPGGPGLSAATVEVGKTTTIALPESADAASVTWESSDESVATVSASGEVTGVAAGKTVITAKDKDGKTVTSKPLSVEAAGAEAQSEDKEE